MHTYVSARRLDDGTVTDQSTLGISYIEGLHAFQHVAVSIELLLEGRNANHDGRQTEEAVG